MANNTSKIYTFYITENEAGGDCLFRAIAAFELETEDEHREIRDRICQYIQENWSEYMYDILAQHQEEISYFETLVAKGVDEITDEEETQALNKYKTYMSKLGNYGTISELIAAGNLLKFNFIVLQEYSDRVDARTYILNENWRWAHFLFTGNYRNGHWRLIHPSQNAVMPKVNSNNSYKKISSKTRKVYVIEEENITNSPQNSSSPADDAPKCSTCTKLKQGDSNPERTLPKRARRISVSPPGGQHGPGLEVWEKEIADAITAGRFVNVPKAVGLTVATISPSNRIYKFSPGARTPLAKALHNMILRTRHENVFFSFTGNIDSTVFTPFLSVKKDQLYCVFNKDKEKDGYVYCQILD